MSKKIVLEVKHLGKRFKVYPSSWGRIKEWMTFGMRSYHNGFWSLKDVSFRLHEGEFIGVIGPNGAGKSTLLKVITGALEATTGSINISGRVLSLLELNGGMDLNLTGRENILRSTNLLGFPDEYATKRMEEIAEFAELGDFFDRPLNTYSSGMRIRLAFSMFAFLDCDILILDEVLAVGDLFFRQKCYARLEQLIQKKTAIILVTQSTGIVNHYCDTVIVMHKGGIIFQGKPAQGIQTYFDIKNQPGRPKAQDTYIEEEDIPQREGTRRRKEHSWPPDALFHTGTLPKTPEKARARLTHLLTCDEKGRPKQVFQQGEKAVFYFAYKTSENMGVPVSELQIKNVLNTFVHGKDTLQSGTPVPKKIKQEQTIRIRQTVILDIAPGNYIYHLGLYALHPQDYERRQALSNEEYVEKRVTVARIQPAGMFTVIPAKKGRGMGLHNGICNLDGELDLFLAEGSPAPAMRQKTAPTKRKGNTKRKS